MSVASEMQPSLYGSRIQRSFVGVCVALLVVTGLVSMPTTCSCGAGVPHGHSLFILPGHHHGVDGVTFGGHDHANHHGHHHPEEYSSATGPQMAGRIMHNADRVAVALPLLEVMAQTWQRISQPLLAKSLGEGRVDTPEAPPPRIWHAGYTV